MKHLLVRATFIVGSTLLLSGCGGRVFDWAKEHFDQGCPVNQHLERARCFIRTERIYDQFTLVGGFSAIWLSDVVREEYVELHAYFRAKTETEKKAMLRRQLAENDHFIQFYVLSANDITLGKYDSDWSLVLRIADKIYSPHEVKEIELSQEYILIFDKLWDGFQTPYLVKFAAKDVDGNLIIPNTTTCISLEFRTFTKECSMNWVSFSACDMKGCSETCGACIVHETTCS